MISTATPLFTVDSGRNANDEPGSIEKSVQSSIDELRSQGVIAGKYAAICDTLIATARAVDAGMQGGPRGISVATSNLTKLLLEGLQELPEPQTGVDPTYDALDVQIKALTANALGNPNA